MSAKSSRHDSLKGKRLPFVFLANPRLLFAGLLTASMCLLMSACGDDDKSPDISTSSAQQGNPGESSSNNAATPGAAQSNPLDQPAQPSLPARTIQTPPPSTAQLGAAASDSLAPPVIHTVD